MRAVRRCAFGADPVLSEVPIPARAAGQSLVRVTAAGVGHLDLTIATGEFGVRPELPYIGGTDGAGAVVESDTVPAGQRVLLRGGSLGLTRPGCWAEFVVVEDAHLIPDDSGFAPALAATFLAPASTAWVAVHDVAEIAPGERVIVGGAAGAVGRIVAQLAARAGAEVLGVVGRESSLEHVPEGIPAVTVADLPATTWADAVIDTMGGSPLLHLLGATRRGGRAALIGYTRGTTLRLDLPNWLLAEVSLLPVSMIHRATQQRALVPELTQLLAAGEITVPVTEFPLAAATAACRQLAAGRIPGRAALLVADDSDTTMADAAESDR